MSWGQQQQPWGQGQAWSSATAPGAPPAQYRPQQPGYGQQPQQQYGGGPQQYGQSAGAVPYGQPAGAVPYGQPAGGFGAPSCPPGVSPDVWHMFQAVDQDRSGQITAQELQRALMNANWTQFNAETCRLMIGMFDKDRTGTIDVREFADLWKYIHDWRQCFDRFDTDRSGRINSSELGQAFTQFGYRLSENFTRLCIMKFDRDGRREIQFDDFIQCCVMLHSLTNSFRRMDTNSSGTIRIGYEQFLEMVLENTKR